jgi:ATP-dependent RNA helicase RhlE
VDQARKRELLAHLITQGNWQQVLVFTRTKHGANRLAQQLERDGVAAEAIHGNKSQSHRTRTLADFKGGDLRVLVATDIAARGLDIEELPHVVNFDLPHVPEDYVHRIGRTGRAGAEGEAVSLVSAEDKPLFAAVEKLLGRSIEQRVIAGFEPQQSRAAATPQPRPQPQRRTGQPAQRRDGAQARSGRGAGRAGARQGTDERSRQQAPGTASGQGRSAAKAQRPSGSNRTGDAASRSARPGKGGAASDHSRTAGRAPQKSQKAQKQGAFASLLAGARRLIG